MPTKTLNVRFVQAAKPLNGKSTDYWDASLSGFVLRVLPSGQKTWRVHYRDRRSAKKRYLTLGELSTLDCSKAREKARSALEAVREGRDPVAEQQADRQALTFNDLCADYLVWVSNGLSRGHAPQGTIPRRRSWRQKQRTLKPLRRMWRDRRAADITRADVRAVVNAKAEKAGYQGNRLLSEIRRVFNYALENDLLPSSSANPATHIKPPVEETARDRALSEDEIRQLWKTLDEWGDVPTRGLFRVALLTGQRIGEICRMRWEDIDDRGWWTIPASDTKNKRAHLVPLPSMARQVLEGIKVYRAAVRKRAEERGYMSPAYESPYVFQSPRLSIQVPMKNPQKALERLREAASIDGIRCHDFRRTAVTLMGMAGVPEEWKMRAVNHIVQTVTRKHYDKHDYVAEKTLALQRLEEAIRSVLESRRIENHAIAAMRALTDVSRPATAPEAAA